MIWNNLMYDIRRFEGNPKLHIRLLFFLCDTLAQVERDFALILLSNSTRMFGRYAKSHSSPSVQVASFKFSRLFCKES